MNQRKQPYFNLHIITGLAPNAKLDELKWASRELRKTLRNTRVPSIGPLGERMKTALAKMDEVIEGVNDPEVVKGYAQLAEIGPRLGNLLVASGVVTFDELEAALEAQQDKSLGHMAIGKILVSWCYLSQEQLDYFIELQDVLKLPFEHPKRALWRLSTIGLISREEAQSVDADQLESYEDLCRLLVEKRWLPPAVMARVR